MPTSIAGTVTTVGIEGAEVEAGLDPGLGQGADLTSHQGLLDQVPGQDLIQDQNRGLHQDPRSRNWLSTEAQEKVHQTMMNVKKKVKRIKM